MALAADHSDLPRAKLGNRPDPRPRFGAMLARAWATMDEPEWERPMAIDGTRLRVSWAGKCARDIGYRATGVAPSNPMTLSGHWRTGLGRIVHTEMQQVFTAAFGEDCEVEKLADLRPFDVDGSGHMDVFLVTKPEVGGAKRIVIEVKTVGGFKFKKQVGNRGVAEGPATTAVHQGALYALSADADELILISISLECMSEREVAKLGLPDDEADIAKFVAEWTLDRAGYTAIAEQELGRLRWIQEILDAGELPPRYIPFEMPPQARIVNPRTGAWTLTVDGKVIEAGDTWMCNYCDYQLLCGDELAVGK